jgi:phosphoserine aminotransferase
MFSSGPCAKRPGWTPNVLGAAVLGRSHRAQAGKAKLLEIARRCRTVLGLPEDYRIGVVPASDTGAMEAALWSLLGPRGVDCLAWEQFGLAWQTDVLGQLKLPDVRRIDAPYGRLPDLATIDWDRDVVFVWNGTTSGVRVPDGRWIADARAGLTICDATSAVFAMDVPWEKLDVATFSWQKALGGEAQHGMLVLGPRAVERINGYAPRWPIPKVLQLTKGGRLHEDIFQGGAINTPSLLCVEDFLDALRWAEGIGGLPGLIARSKANFNRVDAWVAKTPWVQFLAEDPATRSTTSVCLKVVDPWFTDQGHEARWRIIKRLCAILENEHAGFDLAGYREAPPGLRVWCGATVEEGDVAALLPWIDWAYRQLRETAPCTRS